MQKLTDITGVPKCPLSTASAACWASAPMFRCKLIRDATFLANSNFSALAILLGKPVAPDGKMVISWTLFFGAKRVSISLSISASTSSSSESCKPRAAFWNFFFSLASWASVSSNLNPLPEKPLLLLTFLPS